MAKSILKLTETLAIVKIVGAGTETINLSTELLSPTQIVSGTPTVGINFVQWTTGGTIMVRRNSVDVLQLYTNTGGFDLSGNGGMIDATNGTHNIEVVVTTGGTCFLTLRKISGYASKIEPHAFGQYDNTEVVGS
jgi:hypothetical protein